VLYPVVRQSLRISRAFARAADKALAPAVNRDSHVRQLLAKFQGTERQAQQLAEIASRPAEQSLFESMQLFYLDRMVLALVSLVTAFATAHAVRGFWAKGGALTLIGVVFAALNAALGARRRTDAHPMLREAARRVAQVFDVKYIVMGHSHRAVEETVGAGTRYFNLGSWTPGRSHDGFPHVVVTAGSAEQISRIVATMGHPHDSVEQLEPRLSRAIAWTEEFVPAADRTTVRTEPDAAAIEALSSQEREWLALLLQGLQGDLELDAVTSLVYGVPKLARGMSLDEKPTDEVKADQKEFFRLLYHLLVDAERGPRLPTLIVALGADRVRRLLGA